MEQEDQILLDELKLGNKTAYGKLFHKYYKAMLAKAYFMVSDEMEAEDLVQNLFVDIWQKQHYHQINFSIKAYLFRALHNRCLISIESRKKAQGMLENYPATIIESENENNYQEACFAKFELALEQLPEKRQWALRLVHIEGKKYKQAAEVMGISVNSVKTHLMLALRVLKKNE